MAVASEDKVHRAILFLFTRCRTSWNCFQDCSNSPFNGVSQRILCMIILATTVTEVTRPSGSNNLPISDNTNRFVGWLASWSVWLMLNKILKSSSRRLKCCPDVLVFHNRSDPSGMFRRIFVLLELFKILLSGSTNGELPTNRLRIENDEQAVEPTPSRSSFSMQGPCDCTKESTN